MLDTLKYCSRYACLVAAPHRHVSGLYCRIVLVPFALHVSNAHTAYSACVCARLDGEGEHVSRITNYVRFRSSGGGGGDGRRQKRNKVFLFRYAVANNVINRLNACGENDPHRRPYKSCVVREKRVEWRALE